MSTIKANRYENTATTDGGLSIDSSGRLLVGTSSDVSPAGFNNQIQVNTNSYTASILLRRDSADDGAGNVVFAKSRSGSLGGHTVVQNGDDLGKIIFYGADGTDTNSTAAVIAAQVDGTPGANDMPGRIVFSTSADGASSPSERMRITSSGRVGVNTSSPAMRLDVKGTVSAGSGTDEDLQQWNIGSDNVKAEIKYVDASADRGMRFGTSTDHILAFQTNNSERMRITNAGTVNIGTSTNGLSSATDTSFRVNSQNLGGEAFNLRANGNATFAGSVTATNTAKAWVNFNGTGTVAIRANHNVSSITDNATGDYTINFSSSLADANYAVTSIGQNVPGVGNNGTSHIYTASVPTASAVRILYSIGNSPFDPDYGNVVIFR